MLFTSRNLKLGTLRPNNSDSKDSKGSKSSQIVNKKQKIKTISQSQLKLRDAINIKYQKSKIRYYKFSKLVVGFDKQKSTFSDSSINSSQMPQYANLLNQRYVNLYDYHNKTSNKIASKQYLIKTRKSQHRKNPYTQTNLQTNSKLYSSIEGKQFQQFKNKQIIKQNIIFEGPTKQRKTVSEQKKQSEWKKLGFDYQSTSKNSKNQQLASKRATSQIQQTKSRLFYFRKQNKSPSAQQSKYN